MDPSPLPKTPAEHLDLLRGLAALQVRFALDWAAGHPGTRFSQALADRTLFLSLGAWNRAGPFDDPDVPDRDRCRWEAFLAAADALTSEAEILALLPPDADYFLPRVGRDLAELHDPVRGLAARPGCLWINPDPWTLALPEDPSAPRILEFHIANQAYPDSFLRYPGRLRAELRSLALLARDRGYAGVGTRSWLNDHPAWVSVFPPVWARRRTPADPEAVGGHLGVWGQALTARQTLSARADRFLREHRRFEFAMRASWMTVGEALEGLAP